MMTTDGGNLQRAARLQLATHVGQIRAVVRRCQPSLGDRSARQLLRTAQPAAHFGQRVGNQHIDIGNQRGFGAFARGTTTRRPRTARAISAGSTPETLRNWPESASSPRNSQSSSFSRGT
jgi:hypothetical protein